MIFSNVAHMDRGKRRILTHDINDQCPDRMSTCGLIKRHNLCNTQIYYAEYCCASCTANVNE